MIGEICNVDEFSRIVEDDEEHDDYRYIDWFDLKLFRKMVV